MRIAIIGYGGVSKAFLQLIIDKINDLNVEDIYPVIKYVISSKGGIYDYNGIDIKNLLKFSKLNDDITKYPLGGSSNIGFKTLINNKDIRVYFI